MAFWERCEDGGTLFSREGARLAIGRARELPATFGLLRSTMADFGTILLRNPLLWIPLPARKKLGSLHLENCIASTETFWILYVQVNKGLR